MLLALRLTPHTPFTSLGEKVETGTPFMLFKDHCNEKSNQKNLGTIKCSNLCTEVVEYTAPDEVSKTKHVMKSFTELILPFGMCSGSCVQSCLHQLVGLRRRQ